MQQIIEAVTRAASALFLLHRQNSRLARLMLGGYIVHTVLEYVVAWVEDANLVSFGNRVIFVAACTNPANILRLVEGASTCCIIALCASCTRACLSTCECHLERAPAIGRFMTHLPTQPV